MKKVIYYLFAYNLFVTQVFAEDTLKFNLKLDNAFQNKNLLHTILYFEDQNRIYDINKISESITNSISAWNSTGEKELSFGFTKSVYWIHFSIQNESTKLDRLYLECNLATMDNIELYFSDSSQAFYNKKVLGDIHPFKEREVKYRTNVFLIPVKRGEETKIFLRLENKGPMKFSLFLRSPDEFSAHVVRDQVFLGIYYGIMIVIFFYNLFLYLSIQEKTYLYYIHYVASVALYQFIISGNAAQFLFDNAPEIANRAPNIVANLSFITAMLFTRSFLNSEHYTKRFDKILLLLTGISTLLLIIILILGHEMILMKVSNLLGLAMIISIISTAIQVYRIGYRPARFFLFGWSFLLVTIFIQIMANLGAFNITAEHFGQIGSAIEVILLSLALADKMKANSQEPVSIPSQTEIQNETESEKKPDTNPKETVRRPLFTRLQVEYGLTYQQSQICCALVDGKSRTFIAKELDISLNTLKKHLSEIYNKTINKIDTNEIPSQEKLQKLTVFLHSLKPKD
ncbi:MAG TPA: 7TM diverse intracellular signaling domain-containing protein [Leptospiraceae bacterium]|nr:7TM diverse intracellular signaling domain-containing protein [Leptospiraceae bacterium]HNC01132.1 7TM diverse intracellular signaling domain-containing protein [Leptospiraceae bacterium]HNE52177.1 7TM diverse intracellular signaling domain-containing protein [Leptospiraceae bacterium]HNH53247.1 7TM diverse intracellular signaling domain-containing protein [Leptospiraceae bacterium]HNM87754.1 7TM diverse intracellular signaling domain-containing protein [Leptospiraceae bacterium]